MLHVVSHLNLTQTHHLYFTDDKTEAQRDYSPNVTVLVNGKAGG